MTKNRRPRRSAFVAILLVAAVAAAAGILTRDSSHDDADGKTSATPANDLGFPAPESADAAADREYLAGDGRILLVMHERASALSNQELISDQCEREAQALDDAAAADEVLGRIGGLADPVLRDAFHAERTALGVTLTRCITGDASDKRVPSLAQAVEAVEVRLGEVGR